TAHPPGKLNMPAPITRRNLLRFETAEEQEKTTTGTPYYYGPKKSFSIWTGSSQKFADAKLLDPSSLVVADLTDWAYRPLPKQVAIDPALGRIAFPPTQTRRQAVWVSFYYGFSADIGGGEYDRVLSEPPVFSLYRVGATETFTRINEALTRWRSEKPANA